MKKECRYCGLEIISDEVITHSYWGGFPFPCHKSCMEAGIKQEAFDCQVIDADCNDCKHYKRGHLVYPIVSRLGTRDGVVEVSHQPNAFTGTCLKFNKPTLAQPNKWSGFACFEHRRG